MKEVKIKKIKKIGRGNVIDIEVENNHNFMLKNGVLTHNCDRISIAGQDAMRQLIEDTESITRFFFLANNENAITDAIKSRCSYHLNLNDPPGKGILYRCMEICKKENVKIENKTEIVNLIKKAYPDVRKIIGTLQSNVTDNKIKSVSFSTDQDIYSAIFQLMKKQEIDEVRKKLKSNFIQYDDLINFIYSTVMDNPDLIDNPGEFILTTGEYLYKDSIVNISEINFMAYFFDLMKKGIL